ncbi:MAG: GNAT family N-acetyltransferase [Desulfobacteraceae bacterium]|nr:GNAT family N-acetyltransferase [Desulfobacteraceae bacterium]
MEIKQTNRYDLDEILNVYDSARQYMLEHGNPNQWIYGYPDVKTILLDIGNGNHFICVDGNQVLGCFVFIEGDDPTYREIVNGKWLNNNPYAVIHRIAVLEHGKGIGSNCIEWCYSRCKNIKIDTHNDNISMQKLLVKNGFQYCGMIYNRWGDERLAFQRA